LIVAILQKYLILYKPTVNSNALTRNCVENNSPSVTFAPIYKL